MARLTEAQIRDLFLEFSRDYQSYQRQHYSEDFIWEQLRINLQYTLNNPRSTLSKLEVKDKALTFRLLEIFWRSRHEAPHVNNVYHLGERVEFRYVHSTPRCYCHQDSFLYDYLWMNALFARPVYPVYRPFWGFWPFYGGLYNHRHHHGHHHSHHHGHRHRERNDENTGSLLALLAVLAVGCIGFILSGLAIYYLVQHMANDIERLYYNEGVMRALLHMSTTMASAVAGMLFAGLFLSAPLIALGISAGMASPIILAVLGIVVGGFVAGAAGCFFGNKIQEWQIKTKNAEKIDPLEPQRFSITESDEKVLNAKNLDPLSARAALVALRAKIADIEAKGSGAEQKEGTKPLPFFFERHYGAQYKKDIQEVLQLVRQIKSGNLTSVNVDGMHFDFRTSAPEYKDQLQPSAPPASPDMVYREFPNEVPRPQW